jgi:hypothetical protein
MPAEEELYDLILDPAEAVNLVADPAHAAILEDLRRRLAGWMADTNDPLLAGAIAPAAGTERNLPDQRSPSDPTVRA